jgi:AcrR family transcriptional regulator
MNAASRPRLTRDRPAKAPLSLDAIVDAALAIVSAEGLDAVSMRRVATALDTGAGSLYVYVDSREALVDALSDRVLDAIALEVPDPRRWRQQLHALAGRMLGALVAHPGLAAASMITPPQTEATFRLLENLLGILLAGGLDPQDAVWTADMIAALVTYTAIEAEVRRPDATAMVDDVRAAIAGLPADRFPILTAHAAQLVSGDVDRRFRFAIDVVLDGVSTKAPESPAGPSARPTARRRTRR